MNHNVYLPDEISERIKRAKDAGTEVNLSGLLREAVTDELDRLDALEQAKDGMVRQTVDVQDRDGAVRLRFTGKLIVGYGIPFVYLTEDGKVVLVWGEGYDTFDDVDEFQDWVSDPDRNVISAPGEEIVASALGALGGRRVVDL